MDQEKSVPEEDPPLPQCTYPYKNTPPLDLQTHPTSLVDSTRRQLLDTNIVRSLTLSVVSDLDQMKSLWSEFSPNRTLFDTWDFRFAFHNNYHYQPYFLVLHQGATNCALLPLCFNHDENRYEWFGTSWQEDNTFFVKDLAYIPHLLQVAPRPLHLNAMKPETLLWLNDLVPYSADDQKFTLSLSHLKSGEDFLGSLKKKRRYNIHRDVKIIERQSPQVVINHFSDFHHMVKIATDRFAQKGGDPSWADPRSTNTFRDVLKYGRENSAYTSRMISVYIDGQVAAVDLVVMKNHTYYPLKCAYNVSQYPGIGNFVNMYEINDAISLGMKSIDFLEVNYGWKDKWFQAEPLVKYESE